MIKKKDEGSHEMFHFVLVNYVLVLDTDLRILFLYTCTATMHIFKEIIKVDNLQQFDLYSKSWQCCEQLIRSFCFCCR